MEKNPSEYKIIIVDDEPMITSGLKTLLSVEGGYCPEVFNSAGEALEYIKNISIDLVITDFFMPGLNGIEFLKEIKKIHPEVSTILLTGYADKESAIKAINEIGLYRYIEKPWDNEDLLLSIKNALERSYLMQKLCQKVFELEVAKTQLEHYSKNLEEEVNKRTNELIASREDFAATLAHDLRTPLLAAIQTLSFFLDGTLGNLDEKQKQFLETMLVSNRDMLGLVNALLEVYRYESGQLVLCKDYFDLKDFINGCITEIHPLSQKKDIEISACSLPDNQRIYADRGELRRVIANLLGNAVKYTQAGGMVKISAASCENDVKITVEDNGSGIPPEDISRLFNRFSQGTSIKRSTGTGLGLYLSRQIVEAHGGNITVESVMGEGSKFVVSIPKD